MAISLPGNIMRLLRDSETVRVLTTTDSAGEPHVVFKSFIGVDEMEGLYVLELLESSQTNHNLVHSLWFSHRVAIGLRGKGDEDYEIKGLPRRCVISGPVFERYYRLMRESLGDVDLAAVWFITPEKIRDETFWVRSHEEAEAHPLFMHLDRIAKR